MKQRRMENKYKVICSHSGQASHENAAAFSRQVMWITMLQNSPLRRGRKRNISVSYLFPYLIPRGIHLISPTPFATCVTWYLWAPIMEARFHVPIRTIQHNTEVIKETIIYLLGVPYGQTCSRCPALTRSVAESQQWQKIRNGQ